MPLNVQTLEELLGRLRKLSDQLHASNRRDAPLNMDDPLVRLANECEFMLPSPLTVQTLSETVERKIGNVMVLLDRARQHVEIPPDAQAAAENEDSLVSLDDRRAGGRRQSPAGRLA